MAEDCKLKLSPSVVSWLVALLLSLSCLAGCDATQSSSNQIESRQNMEAAESAAEDFAEDPSASASSSEEVDASPVDISGMPEYSGKPAVEINGNQPMFSSRELAASYGTENYGKLDSLGRCTTAFAMVGEETMPTAKRGDISSIKPTGWRQAFYDCVDNDALYNRCHLVGYQLTAENANEKNLITGTRYMNVDGMEPFESEVADYVKETGNHVAYRITPLFDGDNLVASGVQMEALSVEDNGAGICFNVYCYNVQPGVKIDYATGESSLAKAGSSTETGEAQDYVLNVKSHKIHLPGCSGVKKMSSANRKDVHASLDELEQQGYEPCGLCNP